MKLVSYVLNLPTIRSSTLTSLLFYVRIVNCTVNCTVVLLCHFLLGSDILKILCKNPMYNILRIVKYIFSYLQLTLLLSIQMFLLEFHSDESDFV